MKLHKLRAGEAAGTYVMESPVTEADILKMAQQLARRRLTKGVPLTDPDNAIYHLDRNDLQDQSRFFHRSSYLCKEATKIYGNRQHAFGSSRG